MRQRSRLSVVVALVVSVGCAANEGDDTASPPGGGKADGGANRVTLNDVSILFPLPATEAARKTFLWLMPRTGEQGPYFPADLSETLPPLNGDVPDALGYPSAMVTALRYDPCFPMLGGPSCQAQIRLIAQPVVTSATGVQMLDDAAVHLFYKLDASEAQQVVDKLLALKALSPVSTDGVLRVHPGFASSSFATAVRELVVAHCRQNNLIRVTLNTFAFDNWSFLKLDFINGELVSQQLQNMVAAATSQGWIKESFVHGIDDPTGRIVPRPVQSFEYLLSLPNFTAGKPNDVTAAQAAADTLLRIENPALTSTDTVDCVGCHIATQTRLWAQRNGVTFDGPSRYQAPTGYDTSLQLAPILGGNTGATILFGYHHHSDGKSYPSIGQRTINESAEIADFIARSLPQ